MMDIINAVRPIEAWNTNDLMGFLLTTRHMTRLSVTAFDADGNSKREDGKQIAWLHASRIRLVNKPRKVLLNIEPNSEGFKITRGNTVLHEAADMRTTINEIGKAGRCTVALNAVAERYLELKLNYGLTLMKYIDDWSARGSITGFTDDLDHVHIKGKSSYASVAI